MRVYVAGKFADRERVREVQALVRARGHSISWDWTDQGKGQTITPEEQRAIAERDLKGVRDADAFVLVIEQPYIYKGPWVELGAALAFNIPVYVLGESTCVFLHMPSVHPFEELPIKGAL
jgi:nucleoside 2-deoxyribosyltransferase